MAAGAPSAVRAAARALRSGRLVAVPTETVYGVAAALTADAIERLLAAKRRSPSKGITLLVDTLDQVEALAVLPPAARLLAAAFWPGPLTLVLPERPDARLPRILTGGRGSVGFRLPDHPVPRALARELGPIPLTSANVSGEPDATTAAGVVAALGNELAIVLDGGQSPGGVPSTVVALVSGEPEPRIVREGALSAETIAAAIGAS
jgi:tRNA threonylcarbamoyl adenosine modification protein (Sua5/YciO/YrdC/YwlC family)